MIKIIRIILLVMRSTLEVLTFLLPEFSIILVSLPVYTTIPITYPEFFKNPPRTKSCLLLTDT